MNAPHHFSGTRPVAPERPARRDMDARFEARGLADPAPTEPDWPAGLPRPVRERALPGGFIGRTAQAELAATTVEGTAGGDLVQDQALGGISRLRADLDAVPLPPGGQPCEVGRRAGDRIPRHDRPVDARDFRNRPAAGSGTSCGWLQLSVTGCPGRPAV